MNKMSYFADDTTVDKWEFPPPISGRWVSGTDSAFGCAIQWGDDYDSDIEWIMILRMNVFQSLVICRYISILLMTSNDIDIYIGY